MRRARIALLVLCSMALTACVTGWFAYAEARATLVASGQSALRLASDRLNGQLERYRALPAVMAAHPDITQVLGPTPDIPHANSVLKATADATGALDLYVMNANGTTIASSNWDLPHSFVGKNFSWRPYFKDALARGQGAYHAVGTTSGRRGFYYAAPVAANRGVVVVKIDLEVLEARWAADGPVLFFVDDNGVIFLGNRPALVFRKLGATPIPPEPMQYASVTLTPLDPGGDGRFWRAPQDLGTPSPAFWVRRPVEGVAMVAHALLDPAPARRQAVLWGGLGAAIAGMAWLAAAILLLRRKALSARLRAEAAANARLESQVAARTQELSHINARLQAEVEERTVTEAALRQVQGQLVQAGKLKALGEMSAGISHELNQPLTAIQSLAENAEVFLDRQDTVAVADNLTRIGQLAARMGRIIRNLRAFARKEGEAPKDVDLIAVIADAVALVEPRLRGGGVTLRWDRPATPLNVRGGRVRLQQVLVNLISNAIDAMADQQKREITLATETTGARIRITVTDTGPGLSDPDRIFDPFFTTKQVGASLGLGLSISYGIVQSFGGEIRGENLPNGGAVFTVELDSATTDARAA